MSGSALVPGGQIWLLGLLVLQVLCLFPSHRAMAKGPCPGTAAVLADPKVTEASVLCEAAGIAEDFLRACAVHPRRAYGIRVDAALCGSHGRPVFGQYRPNHDEAVLLPAAGCAALVGGVGSSEAISALKMLPPHDVYRSFVVHEVTHAIVHQNLAVKPTRPLYEYISMVAQLQSLPETSRSIYLSSFGEVRAEQAFFNELVLAMEPALFGVAAYRHFLQPENGCGFVRRLLSEERVLIELP